ncbi:hypothetical protein [Microbacterium sp. G2-8]|uniref:hypothetical protein n=1 Tax=Microbacterium sp. G2-8 TaxID=2842454 RepID=UPI001C8AC614|nr:hypothetical protein [Microbacterium sp. G2-8]
MTIVDPVYRRVVRRETQAARTAPAVIVALTVLALLAAGAVVAVGTLLDPDLRDGLRGAVSEFGERIDAGTLAIGAGASLGGAGVLLVAASIVPGRRGRHARVRGRTALVVDDGVIADIVADAVSARCGLDRARTSATIGRRRVRVRIVPTSGVPVDDALPSRAAREVLDEIGFDAEVSVTVAEKGVVS